MFSVSLSGKERPATLPSSDPGWKTLFYSRPSAFERSSLAHYTRHSRNYQSTFPMPTFERPSAAPRIPMSSPFGTPEIASRLASTPIDDKLYPETPIIKSSWCASYCLALSGSYHYPNCWPATNKEERRFVSGGIFPQRFSLQPMAQEPFLPFMHCPVQFPALHPPLHMSPIAFPTDVIPPTDVIQPTDVNTQDIMTSPLTEEAQDENVPPSGESVSHNRSIYAPVEKFLMKIADFHGKLRYQHLYSPSHYKVAIIKLLAKSRSLFYNLESRALREILTGCDVDWSDSDKIEEVFQHEYLSLADNLAVHLLQLILTYSEHGYVAVDQDNPLSIASFYRGEIRLGRILPGLYQVHITSYQYTTLSNLLQLSPCPLDHCTFYDQQQLCDSSCDLHSDISDDVRAESDVDDDLLLDDVDMPMTSEEIETTSSFLKILRWRVRFLQNPDMEEENYYLCCKAVRPHCSEPEFILQLDAVQYVFGKLLSPKMNFSNPTLDEITLECRPTGRFEILRSFGHNLPAYSTVVGALVAFLRHERFRRSIF